MFADSREGGYWMETRRGVDWPGVVVVVVVVWWL